VIAPVALCPVLALAAAPITLRTCLSCAGTITWSISLLRALPASFIFNWSWLFPLSIVNVNALSVVNW
jgi:hypothetical protein